MGRCVWRARARAFVCRAVCVFHKRLRVLHLAETAGADVYRSFEWAREYADRVAAHGGGRWSHSLSKEVQTAREQKAAVLLQSIFRGYCARLYAWALRYVSNPVHIASAFNRADADGADLVSLPALCRLSYDARGGVCVGGWVQETAGQTRRNWNTCCMRLVAPWWRPGHRTARRLAPKCP